MQLTVLLHPFFRSFPSLTRTSAMCFVCRREYCLCFSFLFPFISCCKLLLSLCASFAVWVYEGTELSKLHRNTNTGWLNPSYPTSQRLEPLRQRLITVGRFGGFVLFPVVLAFLPRSLPKMICVVGFRISIQFPSAWCSTSNSPARIIATDSAK